MNQVKSIGASFICFVLVAITVALGFYHWALGLNREPNYTNVSFWIGVVVLTIVVGLVTMVKQARADGEVTLKERTAIAVVLVLIALGALVGFALSGQWLGQWEKDIFWYGTGFGACILLGVLLIHLRATKL